MSKLVCLQAHLDNSKHVGLLTTFSVVLFDLKCDSARVPAVSRFCAVFILWFMHGAQLHLLALRHSGSSQWCLPEKLTESTQDAF